MAVPYGRERLKNPSYEKGRSESLDTLAPISPQILSQGGMKRLLVLPKSPSCKSGLNSDC